MEHSQWKIKMGAKYVWSMIEPQIQVIQAISQLPETEGQCLVESGIEGAVLLLIEDSRTKGDWAEDPALPTVALAEEPARLPIRTRIG
jgi:hypothetical protein